MLLEELKQRMFQAMKAGRKVEKEILRVAIGEIETAESRSSEPLTDAASQAILRKLVKSNEETLSLTEDPEQQEVLKAELETLREFLPKSLSVDAIVEALSAVSDAIARAPNDGAAVGVAMKALKAVGATVDGKAVAEAVRRLRTPG
jgi:uncharacterized protein YqeY